jgi:hypothetical protein
MVHTCNSSYSGGRGRRITSARAKLGKPSLRNKRAGDMAQVIEHLPVKCKALVQSPVLQKEKKCIYILFPSPASSKDFRGSRTLSF